MTDGKRQRLSLGLALLLGMAAGTAQAQGVPPRYYQPIPEVAPQSIEVRAAGTVASFPLFASADFTRPMPALERAVLVFHGLGRNAGDYYRAALESRDKAGPAARDVLVLAPQFLADVDIAPNHLPPNMLGWPVTAWAGGEPAATPAPISGFTAIDAVLAQLADAARFPRLRTVVLAGFSAGGQVVQRYAVVGNGETALMARGVAVSYVVSDPSSYLYFTPQRPFPLVSCAGVDHWRYGFGGDVPPYVSQPAAVLEARYITRGMTYLVGLADTDPNHPVLDRSCAGQAQGPHRVARAEAYWAMLQTRHGTGLRHRYVTVAGIAHEGQKMFNSPCGQALLFGTGDCPALRQ